jgi:hypothetical protein
MLRQTLYRRGLNTRLVSVVLFCSLCVGVIPAGCRGCGAALPPHPDTLEILLEGSLPWAYTLEARVPGGQTLTVECIRNTLGPVPGGPGAYGTCQGNGVMFYHFTPSELTVTLLWDTHRMSQTFKPSYATTWREDRCQMYRVGSVSLTIP